MEFPQFVLISATFLCSLVAGFLFAFAVVVMPGINKLNNREFVRAFQVMDGIIQNNHPIFMVVWIGSIIAIISAAVMGFGRQDTLGSWLLMIATLVYIFGVQLPTIIINIPLNNEVKSMNIDSMNETDLATFRDRFEVRWNRSNVIRTILSWLVSVLLIILVLRM